MKTTLEITAEPLPRDLAFLGESLTAFNDDDVGPSGRKPLVVFVLDEHDAVVAGISGYTAWGWLYVQWLWVDERLRGKGVAAGMLDAAEQEAVARGCHGAWIDTFNPIAEKVYRRQGYQPFGELPDFPIGRRRVFLQKKLP
ncbi:MULTISPECIES: GNAT family N-acetyltransferase [unclassified Mesorhizobium]|uniref:GNAT family N-acetyltransferase n=1 Tax=unclassified Mesorhizobium TaxID=325217 RepID=UPI000F760882|nr:MULTISPECIES: GNAT family N-acetyltransferase [unclassified Mesorhizobium]AZO05786.1 GNAT family N-acetyltransferase [Mesorhizobium sp. M2A.F.Ca.ET.043.02.1.1]RUW43154.1 GNAT family N-acetyltransferase [Mesorhizobium sp. M2A.F.Ca.ET.015.02.1.1]RUW75581.1 GNAT family N-acetyltransferase [Mesorhizobium sp. M2A.F.Ca.ET.067.02.1.1]RVC95068.1 GNAT family N-acetyltransferase [Mesorhizobium sp. M2A.F.Ca.ET.017.03.2.1]RVD10358.1 GNAT family N-acetyltransferase [Mesorhizobium sp. M2A.F.Ca.ET.029.05.